MKNLDYKFIVFTLISLLILYLVSIFPSTPLRSLAVINDSDYYNTIKAEEHRKPIAIIDTGLMFEFEEFDPYLCLGGHKDFTGEGLEDKIGHGTNIAWNVVKGLDPDKYCLVIIKWFTKKITEEQSLTNPTKAFKWAEKQNPVLINFSGGGIVPIYPEKDVIKDILDSNKTFVVVAAGNEGKNLEKDCNYYPACYFSNEYMNFHVAGALDKGVKAWFSNYGTPPVTDWEQGINIAGPRGRLIMRGTSQSTALISNKILKSLR